MKKAILTLWMALYCSLSIAGTILPSVPDSKYLEFGDKFTCVQKLEINYGYIDEEKKQQLFGYASCVILSDEWLITSAHIITDQTKTVHLIYNNKKYFIEKMLVHKNADTNTKFSNRDMADLALCKLSTKLEKFDKAVMVDENVKVLGKVVALCGYGNTGTFNTGVTKFDLKKRAGSNRISGISNDILLAETTRNEDHTSLEMLVAGGDSGGGVFIDGKLVGIICFIRSKDKKTSDYGDTNGFIDLRKYKGWVNDIIEN